MVLKESCFVRQNFGSKADTTFCGVFDGHGPYGHFVSKKVRDSLPLKLNSMWELSSNSKNESPKSVESVSTPPTLGCTDEHNAFFLTLKDSFLKAFKVMDKELKLHPRMDCHCSGTTAVTLVKQVF